MHDSDLLHLDERNIIREFTEKGSLRTEGNGFLTMAATGVLFFDRRAVAKGIGSEVDITKALIKGNLDQAGGEGIVTSHYFKDSGTPARLSAIRDDLRTGAFYRRGSRSRPALILDRDGTLIRDAGSSRKDLNREPALGRVAESLASCNRAGIPVFIVTNQPGIAKGELSFADVHNVHNAMAKVLQAFGAWIDGLYFCPHHPESGFRDEVPEFKIICRCRKPKDGLLQTLALEHGINLRMSYFIGDSEADEGAAKSAGVRFVPASFDGSAGPPTWVAIDAALEEMLR
jgi:histidinol-phosphate phosphatase family protein